MCKNIKYHNNSAKEATENADSVTYVKGIWIFIEQKKWYKVLTGHMHIFMCFWNVHKHFT